LPILLMFLQASLYVSIPSSISSCFFKHVCFHPTIFLIPLPHLPTYPLYLSTLPIIIQNRRPLKKDQPLKSTTLFKKNHQLLKPTRFFYPHHHQLKPGRLNWKMTLFETCNIKIFFSTMIISV
jgi:hypothetical protein